jgi:Flp pilus assembly protein TadB
MPKHLADSDTAAETPSRREQAAVAWSGLAFVAAALVGWSLLPQARLVWIVLLVFGAATVPQLLVWRLAGRRP